jgi:hypothetical protein
MAAQMSSRRRITIALVGLILLAVVGWLVTTSTDQHAGPAPTVTVSTPGR